MTSTQTTDHGAIQICKNHQSDDAAVVCPSLAHLEEVPVAGRVLLRVGAAQLRPPVAAVPRVLGVVVDDGPESVDALQEQLAGLVGVELVAGGLLHAQVRRFGESAG